MYEKSIVSMYGNHTPILLFARSKGNLISSLVDRFGNITYITLNEKAKVSHTNVTTQLKGFNINTNIHCVNTEKLMAELLAKYIMMPKKNTNYPINTKGQIILTIKRKNWTNINVNIIFDNSADPDFLSIVSLMAKNKDYGQISYTIENRKYMYGSDNINNEPKLHADFLLYEQFLKDVNKKESDTDKNILMAIFNILVDRYTTESEFNNNISSRRHKISVYDRIKSSNSDLVID